MCPVSIPSTSFLDSIFCALVHSTLLLEHNLCHTVTRKGYRAADSGEIRPAMEAMQTIIRRAKPPPAADAYG
jgi:hypothetical protein